MEPYCSTSFSIAAHRRTGRPRLELFEFSALLRVPLCTIGWRLFPWDTFRCSANI